MEWTRHVDTNLSVRGEPFFTDEAGRPEPNLRIHVEAQAYNAAHHLPIIDHSQYVKVDQLRAGRIADAYDRLPVDDAANPLVAQSYRALADEVVQQYQWAVANGMTFEPWTHDGDAYPGASGDDVFKVTDDVRRHRHMWFFTGGEPNQFMAKIDKSTGLPINDLFRAIHDYFGHCAVGADFGPHGEENAWVSHMQMFTHAARRALTTETRGQNSWVNFGRQNYDANGNYKNILPKDRPYATQKCAVFSGEDDWINHLPVEFHR
jgi:hypothetical protein